MTTEIAPADRSAELIALWLHGRSPHTQAAYRTAVTAFRVCCPAPLDQVTLGDLQAWADQLAATDLAPASRALRLTALKSLLAFGHRIGVLPVDVGAALRVPARRDRLSERILEEAAVQRLLALEPHPRNHALLRLAYATGLRVSELASLTWRDLVPRGDGGTLSVVGKGAKERTLLVPPGIWGELLALRGEAGDEAPVFRSRTRGGALSRGQIERIVRQAARRAGLAANVSPHWLRHAAASHSLDRGAPISLVQATLGHSSLTTTSRYTHAKPDTALGQYLAV